jgi:hypothetical protein
MATPLPNASAVSHKSRRSVGDTGRKGVSAGQTELPYKKGGCAAYHDSLRLYSCGILSKSLICTMFLSSTNSRSRFCSKDRGKSGVSEA